MQEKLSTNGDFLKKMIKAIIQQVKEEEGIKETDFYPNKPPDSIFFYTDYRGVDQSGYH